jgi:hypothetical protein
MISLQFFWRIVSLLLHVQITLKFSKYYSKFRAATGSE